MNKKLIKLLQKAHAGEIAAYHAYEGHWRSLRYSNYYVSKKIKQIQAEELQHRQQIRSMLLQLNAKPSFVRDCVMWCVGQIASALCFVSGPIFAAKGAEFMEEIGFSSYKEMTKLAQADQDFLMAGTLSYLARKEEEHEEFFRSIY